MVLDYLLRSRGSRSVQLGPNQKRFVLAEQFSDGCFMMSAVHRVEGPLDLKRIRHAASALVSRHEALRTSFEFRQGEYRALIHEKPAFQFHLVDLPSGDFETFRQAALPLVMRDVDMADRASLCRFVIGRVDANNWRVCFASHHANSDGFSRSLSMKEIFDLYQGAEMEPAPSYYDFIQAPSSLETERQYWRDTISSNDDSLALPPDVDSPDEASLGNFVESFLDLDDAAFRSQVKRTGASKFGCLAAAYAIGLYRATGSPRPLFTFQSAGRKDPEVPMSVFGSFSNTLPIVCDVDLEASYSQLAAAFQCATQQAVAHERLPYNDILVEAPSHPEFSINSFPRELAISVAGLTIHPREFLDRPTEYAINLVWSQDGARVAIRCYYDGNRYSRDGAAEFVETQRRLVQSALEEPDRTVRDLLSDSCPGPSLSSDFDATPAAGTLIDDFLAQAKANPSEVAIRHPEGDISYDQLLKKCDVIGSAMIGAGVRPGDRIAIVARREPDLIATILGAARAGAAFAVLDSTYPVRRLRDQLDILRPRFMVVMDSELRDRLDQTNGVTQLTELTGTELRDLPGPCSDGPLYFLFTSGTTGVPKCIGHGPQTLRMYVNWAADAFSVGKSDCVSLLSGLNHDPVMRDIFLPLTSGASIAMPTKTVMEDPEQLRSFLDDAGASILHLTPPLGRLLQMGASENSLPSVRLMVWGGDRLSGRQLDSYREIVPSAEHVNLYGASETPQAATVAILDSAESGAKYAPIGRPVPWMTVECLTADGRSCGAREIGELRVSMPFETYSIVPPAESDPSQDPYVRKSVHQTGDRAYPLRDGQLVFVGRTDDQIKIRGYRVELNDIAHALEALPDVAFAVALSETKADGNIRLIAYCEPEPDCAPATTQLRHSLLNALPDHMVPEQILVVGSIPLLPNGKIDRQGLESLGRSLIEEGLRDSVPEEPNTPEELEILNIYQKVSGNKRTNIKANLIDYGADSLSGIEARLLLQERGYALPDGWEEMAIHALAASNASAERPAALPGGLKWAGIETFIVVRAVVILSVVALHLGWFSLGGGSTAVLFVLAGYVFSKFMGRPLLVEGRIGRLWSLLATIAITSFPVMLAIFLQQKLSGRPSHLSTIFFYSNAIPHYAGVPNDGRVVWLWYIHCYAQTFLLIALMLWIPRVRGHLGRNRFRGTWMALAGSLLIISLGFWASLGTDTPIRPLSPVSMSPLTSLPLVLLGALMFFAKTSSQKMGFVAITLLLILQRFVFYKDANSELLALGMVLLFFVPTVMLPVRVGRILTVISGASLYIYLMHAPLAYVYTTTLGLGGHPAFLTLGTIAASVVLWKLWQPILVRLGVPRLSEKQWHVPT